MNGLKSVLRCLLKLFFKTKLLNWERLKFAGTSVILPNHVSFLDAIFLYAYLPGQAFFVVNTEIAARFRWVMRFVNHVAIDPLNPYSLKKIVTLVKAGQTLVLFPEGRITRTGGIMKVYSGVALIALKTQAKLYPVIFLGAELSKVSRIQDKVKAQWLPQVTVYAGRPIQLTGSQDQSFRLQKKEMSDRILALLQQNLFEAKQEREVCTNLFDKVLEISRTYSSKIIAEDISGKVNYRKLIIGSYVLADRFRIYLAKEEKVGILLPNSIGHLVTLFALFYLGKTPAIFNFSAGAQTNLECGQTAGVKTILTSRLFIEKGNFHDLANTLSKAYRLIYLEDLKGEIGYEAKIKGLFHYLTHKKAVSSEEASVILFTSGSESKPKGVLLKHTNILANIQQISCVIDYTPKDKMFNALPMFHSFGLTAGTLLPVLSGMEVFLYPTPLHYKMIPELVYDRDATLLLGTPTFLHGYGRYANPYDFYNLRLVLAGGEKLKDEVRTMWQEKFGLRIFEGYGTTETSPVLSLNTPIFNRIGSVGKLLPGLEYRLEEVPGIEAGGNLLVKGPNVMAGYLLFDQGFQAAPEWYDCGDVVRIDQEGFIHIQSRLKRFAKISGEMISLDAVEKAAEKCFGTDRNAAVSVSHDKKGEKILLYTMKKDASKQQLRQFMSLTRQSMLVMPTEVIVVDQLPLLGSGKIDYVTLKKMAEQEE